MAGSLIGTKRVSLVIAPWGLIDRAMAFIRGVRIAVTVFLAAYQVAKKV